MPESLVFSCARIFSVLLCQNLIPCFLTFVAMKDQSLATHFLNFKCLFILVCLFFIAYLHKYIVFTSTCPIYIYCILRGRVKVFNSAVYTIKCQEVRSYRTVVG